MISLLRNLFLIGILSEKNIRTNLVLKSMMFHVINYSENQFGYQ